MFDHVGIVVADLERSARFYGRVLALLGLQILEKHSRGPNDGWVVISSGAPRSPFFVIAAGRLCFAAPSWASRDRRVVRLPFDSPLSLNPGIDVMCQNSDSCTAAGAFFDSVRH